MQPGRLWIPPQAEPEQRQFIVELLGEDLDVSRISALIVDQLADSYAAGASHMHGIIDAIKSLEGVGKHTNAKEAEPFKRKPLIGLWHVHYLSAIFLAKNLMCELEERGEAAEATIDRTLRNTEMTSDQKLKQLAHDMTIGLFQTRNQEKRMTGEWVVYAKDAVGANHYLAAASHAGAAVNRALLDLIRARCERRFVALLP